MSMGHLKGGGEGGVLVHFSKGSGQHNIMATMMHKCINKLVPDYLADMFKSRSQVHNRQTRSSGALDIPLCRLSTGQRSFAFRGAKLWNSLNDNIKSLKCPRNFRRHLANVLLS